MAHVFFRRNYVHVRELDLSEIIYLESDPEHRPRASLNYTPVDDAEFLELFTTAFNNHPSASSMMAELNCTRVRFVGGLPRGFACFQAPQKEGRHADRYIYGHHENTRKKCGTDKAFKSLKQFVPHVFWIIVDQPLAYNRPRGCLCKLCAENTSRI
ncbi:hypothetical protein E4T48_00589 [Aureobasidium sp. EXF-10727]|nr:hypothetical protein E4T48_00589 [Aureobasidium sp. EXF-10727]